jgi:adenylate cyclase
MIKLKKLFTIATVWTVIGLIITAYDYLVIASMSSAGFSAEYDLKSSLLLNTIVGFAAGLIGGGFLVYFVNERYREGPYWISLALVMTSFVVVSGSLVLVVSVFEARHFIGWEGLHGGFLDLLSDTAHLKNALVWLIVLVLTQVTLQVNDKFGQNNWINFLLGKYHRAKEETRIFMFVDLNSSTAIAEKLGNERYHQFLKEYFTDITAPIVDHRGEIYQYVGDEVIISWMLSQKGGNEDCLKCYFAMSDLIAGLSEKYRLKYGVVPEFKVGLHFGKVTVGEIGVIKRELTFSGDVLNTTSRIQGKCKEHQVRILVSDELLDILPNDEFYQKVHIGNLELRGKAERVGISTLRFE